MNTTTRVVSRLTTAILIVMVAVTALPATAKAAAAKADRSAPLARAAGYGSPDGSSRVRVLQRRLRLVGENPGPIDGLFGPLTEGAVVRYQQRAGVAVDGVVGPKTRAALQRSMKVVRPGAGYDAPHGSARVRTLQRSLRLAGADPGPVDGRFGPRTEAAVIRFQADHGLAADGLPGERTIGVLGHIRTRVSDRVRAIRQVRTAAHSLVHDLDTTQVKAVEPDSSTSRGGVFLALAVLLVVNAAIFLDVWMSRRRGAARRRIARGERGARM
jgi:peptidoglycan hydrolase-like protein with peptidoglycan-binding domain